jgi:hypothetical protein
MSLLRGHETDMPKYLGDVRCWVNSGKHLLFPSISPFDPDRNSTANEDISIDPSRRLPDFEFTQLHCLSLSER